MKQMLKLIILTKENQSHFFKIFMAVSNFFKMMNLFQNYVLVQ